MEDSALKKPLSGLQRIKVAIEGSKKSLMGLGLVAVVLITIGVALLLTNPFGWLAGGIAALRISLGIVAGVLALGSLSWPALLLYLKHKENPLPTETSERIVKLLLRHCAYKQSPGIFASASAPTNSVSSNAVINYGAIEKILLDKKLSINTSEAKEDKFSFTAKSKAALEVLDQLLDDALKTYCKAYNKKTAITKINYNKLKGTYSFSVHKHSLKELLEAAEEFFKLKQQRLQDSIHENLNKGKNPFLEDQSDQWNDTTIEVEDKVRFSNMSSAVLDALEVAIKNTLSPGSLATLGNKHDNYNQPSYDSSNDTWTLAMERNKFSLFLTLIKEPHKRKSGTSTQPETSLSLKEDEKSVDTYASISEKNNNDNLSASDDSIEEEESLCSNI